MYFRIVGESLLRRARPKLAALAAVALGAGAASGLAMIFLGVGDRMQAEMRKLKANLEIAVPDVANDTVPASLFGQAFWWPQVVGVTPELRVEAGGYTVLGRDPDPAWRVEGRPGVLAGVSLELTPGATVDAGRPLVVTGTVSTGGEEDGEIIVPLATARELPGMKKGRYLVSATVTPEDEAYKLFLRDSQDPLKKEVAKRRYTPKEIEKFNCTPFPPNVVRSLAAAVNGQGRVIHHVAETEGAILGKIESVVWVLALAAVVAACLSVFAAMTAAVIDRRKEVGLLKALGATNGAVAALFLGEALVIAAAGSLLGYGVGLAAAKSMSAALFGNPVEGSIVVYLLTLSTTVVIVVLGVAWPLRLAVRLEPHRVLHEV